MLQHVAHRRAIAIRNRPLAFRSWPSRLACVAMLGALLPLAGCQSTSNGGAAKADAAQDAGTATPPRDSSDGRTDVERVARAAAAMESIERLPSGKPRSATVAPTPLPVKPPTALQVRASMRRGIDYLLSIQNRDGSFGSPTQTKGMNIYAPVPGAHHAFRAAVTSLVISALIGSGDSRSEVQSAIDRAERALLKQLPRVRRADARAMYNIWSHAYGIRALVDMRSRLPQGMKKGASDHKQRIAAIDKQINQQIGLLIRYEFVNGGWGYYDFGYQTQKPSGQPTSFTTATVLIALHRAKQVGAKVPQRIVDRAMKSLRVQQNPDRTYTYSFGWHKYPRFSINKPGGSSGRSQACNLAMRLWGDKTITEGVLKAWLKRLFARQLWLDIGRKRPIPHESHMAIAGYFYYYGHMYAAMCIDHIKPEDRFYYRQQLASIMLARQEKDGKWFDFPFYAYGEPYGTAMGVITLTHCLPEADG